MVRCERSGKVRCYDEDQEVGDLPLKTGCRCVLQLQLISRQQGGRSQYMVAITARPQGSTDMLH
jgi:hypothetical protein